MLKYFPNIPVPLSGGIWDSKNEQTKNDKNSSHCHHVIFHNIAKHSMIYFFHIFFFVTCCFILLWVWRLALAKFIRSLNGEFIHCFRVKSWYSVHVVIWVTNKLFHKVSVALFDAIMDCELLIISSTVSRCPAHINANSFRILVLKRLHVHINWFIWNPCQENDSVSVLKDILGWWKSIH